MKNKNLLAISGKSGSGKDLVAQIIQFLTSTNKDYRKNPHGIDIETFEHWLDLYKEYPGLTSGSPYQVHRFADKLKQIVSLLTGIPREDLEKEEVKSLYLPQEWNIKCYLSIRFSFAEPKETIVPFEYYNDIEGFKRRFAHLGAETLYEKRITVRELLQTIGTQALRDQVHPNIHVNALFSEYKSLGFTFLSGKGIRPPLCNMCDKNTGDYAQYICDECLAKGNYPKWLIPDMRFPNEFEAIRSRGGVTIRVERPYDKADPKYDHPSETGLDDYVYGEQSKFDYLIQNYGTIKDLIRRVKDILIVEEII